MSDKQQLLSAIAALPEGATWNEIAATLLLLFAKRAALTPGQTAELGARLGVIPGVDPADVWEAAADADAGRLVSHDEVFARLRGRK